MWYVLFIVIMAVAGFSPACAEVVIHHSVNVTSERGGIVLNGMDGADGKDGLNGIDGKDGAPGHDGIAGTVITGEHHASVSVFTTVNGETVEDSHYQSNSNESYATSSTHAVSNTNIQTNVLLHTGALDEVREMPTVPPTDVETAPVWVPTIDQPRGDVAVSVSSSSDRGGDDLTVAMTPGIGKNIVSWMWILPITVRTFIYGLFVGQ